MNPVIQNTNSIMKTFESLPSVIPSIHGDIKGNVITASKPVHSMPEIQVVDNIGLPHFTEIHKEDLKVDAEEIVSESNSSSLTVISSLERQENQISVYLSRADKVDLIHEKSEINALCHLHESLLSEADYTRKMISKNLEKIHRTGYERDETYSAIQKAEDTNNTASLFYLIDCHEKLCKDIAIDEEIVSDLRAQLLKTEYELNKCEVKIATFNYEHPDLQLKENIFRSQKKIQFKKRLNKEKQHAAIAVKTLDKSLQQQTEALVNSQQVITHSLEEAKRSRAKVQKYINENLTRMKKKKDDDDKAVKEKLQSRMEMLLKLKSDITANRENIQAIHNRNKFLLERKEQANETSMKVIAESGGNPEYEMAVCHLQNKEEERKKLFEENQVNQKKAIIKRIMNEKRVLKRKKKHSRYLFVDNKHDKEMELPVRPIPDPKYFSRFDEEATMKQMQNQTKAKFDSEEKVNEGKLISQASTMISLDILNVADQSSIVLNAPEFEGLWENKESASDSHQNKRFPIFKSKMDQEIFEDRWNKQREGLTQKSVKFQGPAFTSKPDIIHFKDFEVKKIYKKRVVLTNVSYIVNYCKLVDVSDCLKDFLTISYEPPGNLSVGMTCDFTATFKPMINEDLNGHVDFVSQTGKFSVPVICSIKKCDLSVKPSEVDFGTSVIGESILNYVTLINKGALGTNYTQKKVLYNNDESDSLDGMTVGSTSAGFIAPFSTIALEIMWKPTVPGVVTQEFLVTFDDDGSQDLLVTAKAKAMDVPVWVEQETVDMKICMYERLYQYSLIVNNRAHSALKLTFDTPKELRNHLEILPKTGYIQAQTQFTAQLRFTPKKSLACDAKEFFDPDTGVLERTILIHVAGQARPVPFIITAIVTSSDLAFSVKDINFGYATIYESVKTTIQLSNSSIQPQEFGFLKLPQSIEVQPNDGFGCILPLETMDLDIIFSPQKAEEYSFTITCKTTINRDFSLNIKGVGVLPPLELSHQVIHFAATAPYDMTTTDLYVLNRHVNANEFTHAVPRVGKGDIFPVGPTSFEFVVPEDAPLMISPSVGTVLPDQKCRIEVTFRPQLNEEDIKTKALELATLRMQEEADIEYQLLLESCDRDVSENGKKSHDKKHKTKKNASSVPLVPERPKPESPPSINDINTDSPAYFAAISNLLRNYQNQFTSYTVPCYIGYGYCDKQRNISYSKHNTLYLLVHCPTVKPSLLLVSNNSNPLTDYGNVSLGQTSKKTITVHNTSDQTLVITPSLFHPSGPFTVLNAFRPLPAGGMHTILLSFTPTTEKKYHEYLFLNTSLSTLKLTMTGQGVAPNLKISIDKILDMGTVLAGEFSSTKFKLENLSSVVVNFSVTLDSLSDLEWHKCSTSSPFICNDYRQSCNIGIQNYNGLSVFDCVPQEGVINPGDVAELTVIFSPDHDSGAYSDFVKIMTFGQQENYSFKVIGKCVSNIMYVKDTEGLSCETELLSVSSPILINKLEEPKNEKHEAVPLMLSLRSRCVDGAFEKATNQFVIGCTKSQGFKKVGEFFFENIQNLNAKGFNIQPLKSTVEPGTDKQVMVTWSPPSKHDNNESEISTVIFTTKAETSIQYKLIMRTMVIS